MQHEPTGIADLFLFQFKLGIEYDNEGNIRLTEKGMKRRAILEAVISDLRKHEKTLPSDVLKLYGIILLFTMDESGLISFPYKPTPEWEALKEVLYHFTEQFDEVFAFKRKKGAPISGNAVMINLFMKLWRELDKDDQRASRHWRYLWLLLMALKMRLEKSVDFRRRKTVLERGRALEREFKAAETAVSRSWKSIYQDEPPKLEKIDKELIQGEAVGDSTQLQQFIESFVARFNLKQRG